MKLLLIAGDYLPNIGGVSIFIDGIAESMALAGHRVWVLAPDMAGKNDASLPYRVIRYKRTKRMSNLWPCIVTFYLCLTNKIDVLLYGHAVSTLSAGGTLARKFNLTHLAVLTHGNDLDYAVSCDLDKYYLDCLFRNADLILANSNYTKDKVVQKYPKVVLKTKILNPGVWPDRISQHKLDITCNTEAYTVVLTAGRLVPKKGIDDLINAFALVAAIHPKAILKIVGDGPERENLETLALRLKCSDKIIFTGAKSANEVYTEMKQCSYFVLPSKIVGRDVETFGIVYLEANACGKAVIGTQQGGVPDAIEDGVTGILIEPNNIKQLSKAMLRLTEDKALRDRMGNAGQIRVNNIFTWTAISKKLEMYLKTINTMGN
ncbi:glycosyltransferase family 4 protein [candidate division TA06 bacterium]|nr:glycosyltransferase family 4 protein [candidate division TA06 bacterium]